jgi:heparan-alpha-glucosaminide N-acetyltransferase
MTNTSLNRLVSIDIMRGITLFLMLFVNDLYTPGVPKWMVHTEASYDGMGLADWVFPGFLFMVGLSVPFAMAARRKISSSSGSLLLHILVRSVSLIIIGVVILNGDRINPQLTGISGLWWKALVYVCIFLIWNFYPQKSKYKALFNALQMIGAAGLICLVAVFKAGTPENTQWLEVGWWGILGLIGWGYLVAALAYLVTSDNFKLSLLFFLSFLLLNILTQAGLLHFSGWAGKIFGVVLSGNVPSVTLAGLTAGILIKTGKQNRSKLLKQLLVMGVVCVAAGFILRHWFIISKIYGTPSWAMICNGISILLFVGVYYLTDIKKVVSWSGLFEIAGKNSLTTYLAPDMVYFMCWGFSIPLFFYKQEHNMLLAVGGSVVWSVLMILFAYVLSKLYIKLKL